MSVGHLGEIFLLLRPSFSTLSMRLWSSSSFKMCLMHPLVPLAWCFLAEPFLFLPPKSLARLETPLNGLKYSLLMIAAALTYIQSGSAGANSLKAAVLAKAAQSGWEILLPALRSSANLAIHPLQLTSFT